MSSRNAVDLPRSGKRASHAPKKGEGRKLILAVFAMRGWLEGETKAGYPHITQEHYTLMAMNLSDTTPESWKKVWQWSGIRNVVKYPHTYVPGWRLTQAAWVMYSKELRKDPKRQHMKQPAAIRVITSTPGWEERQKYIYSLSVEERQKRLLGWKPTD